MNGFSRRALLGAASIGAGAALIGLRPLRAATAGRELFPLGVASGEPVADGMVLWTRIAPAPLEPDGGMQAAPVPVRWELSEDEHFTSIRSGTAIADPAWGHAVHVEVAGLKPDRPYWYRFITGGEVSPVGRTRTAPLPGAMARRLRIAFASCQNREAGFYAAYRDMVEQDPDLVFFLGDYIYEASPKPGGVRSHANPEPKDIGGYRVRYADYKSDPLLQAAHRAAPWVTTWDDHEVANNYAGDLSEENEDRAAFLVRRAAAYRAYYEHMPLRAAQRPDGGFLRLYRALDWGSLAQFQILDDRQYRDPPPCQAPGSIEQHLPNLSRLPDCAERHDPSRSILGAEQEAWLMERLGSSPARWNMLTQQTLMMPYADIDPAKPDAPPGLFNTDRWSGFPESRDRVVRRWRDGRTSNPVVLSGDIHTFVAGDHLDPDNREAVVASEFVGGSISSNNHSPDMPETAKRTPGFRFTDIVHRGYGLADISPERCDVTFRGVADARDEDSPVAAIARFTVEDGRPGLQVV